MAEISATARRHAELDERIKFDGKYRPQPGLSGHNWQAVMYTQSGTGERRTVTRTALPGWYDSKDKAQHACDAANTRHKD